METRTILRRLAVMATIILGLMAAAGAPAVAEDTGKAGAAQPVTVVRTMETKQFSITTTFTFPSVPDGTVEAEKLRASVAESLGDPKRPIAPLENAWCGGSYAWFTSEGTFGYQHACGSSKGSWSFTIQPTVQAMITSYVSEQGMDWTYYYETMPRQAPHFVPKDYWFHGTFNPCYDYSVITYYDRFTFRVNVGGNVGNGAISIFGEIVNRR